MTDYNYENRQHLINRLHESGQLHYERRGNVLASCALMFIGMVMGVCIIGIFRTCTIKPEPMANCYTCHARIQAFEDYFRRSGSRNPAAMSRAVLSTRNPSLIAAVAKVETGGNFHVRRSGFRKQHDGAWQVNPRHWGRVPHDAVGQALQAELILAELTNETKDIKKALNQYGGDTRGRYARLVLAELEREVPR